MALSVLAYVKFHQQRYREFTAPWWGWMLATGAALSCTLGCKMVGLLTFLSVGAAVMWDLWGILDVRKNPSMVSVCCTFIWARKYEGRDGKRVL
jgi:dolichyl-phosphate-mannose-protein mannosyltransferase